MLTIRPETPADYEAVYRLNQLAFDGRKDEPELVEDIRKSPGYIPELSLVAVEDGEVVGHILFSHVHIHTENGDIPILALAPMAVLPEYQNKGIGSQLVRHGLQECRRLGHTIVNVLGHPAFYPRFGFRPARALGINGPYTDAPDDAWMIQELKPGALDNIKGTVFYPKIFDGV